jgi:FMN phosphatase YigB (HAD superfamily)
MNWLIDFDDTLVNGPITYALHEVFPEFIIEHGLPFDAEHFMRVVLQCQEIASQTGNDAAILQDLFRAMDWSQDLQNTLLQDVFDNYTPTLFDDAVPFLQRLKEDGHTLYILSNNKHAGDIAAQMELDHYFADVFTPKSCGVAQGKPHAEIWDVLRNRGLFRNLQDVTIIGDDPWSEGLFSERCGIQCWILDRLKRFPTLYDTKPYRWAATLDEVHVTSLTV